MVQGHEETGKMDEREDGNETSAFDSALVFFLYGLLLVYS